MSIPEHTYGPTCVLHGESNRFIRRASAVSELPPKITARFFYSSALPIDDPLSPLPPPSSNPTPSKVAPLPFSHHDNAALEEAWQSLNKEISREHTRGFRCKDERFDPQKQDTKPADEEQVSSLAKEDGRGVDHLTKIVKDVKNKAISMARRDSAGAVNPKEGETSMLSHVEAAPSTPLAEPTVPSNELRFKADPHVMLCDDPEHVPFDSEMPVGSEELGTGDEFEDTPGGRHHRIFHRRTRSQRKQDRVEEKAAKKATKRQLAEQAVYGSSPSGRDTTGTPFIRAPIPSRMSHSPAQGTHGYQSDSTDSASADEDPVPSSTIPAFPGFRSEDLEARKSESETQSRSDPKHHNFLSRQKKVKEIPKAYIPVGISRLHLVEMPDLLMKPIYWSPLHDVSSVVRGTWFYKETMLPVESDVANQLEEGYEYMKPWTQTYVDELNSCVEIGAEAELKICHQLWPTIEPTKQERRTSVANKFLEVGLVPSEADELARKHAAEGAACPENKAAGAILATEDAVSRLYPKSSVIYANARDAQVLRPSLLPSAARGRKPLASIRKGRPIGIPVVRGFDQKAWEKLHRSRKGSVTAKAQDGATANQSGTADLAELTRTCEACSAEDERPKVTDLVLVIHGIGQKLSERMESFHFTHAINAFRRSINIELESEAVKPWLRSDHGGIMVLPINWRSTLTFESVGPEAATKELGNADDQTNYFGLNDITPDTIPAVRNLISDVMLDIPYYLSDHKPKMIEAVIKEANRVYRLWCSHNPGFEDTGRVHLIAHSLGSVMALDILSQQPTHVPKQLNPKYKPKKTHDDIFEFDTKSLFLCGSPAGFFLLLNKASLLPRRGRNKPNTDGEDLGAGVGGEAGTYGCLAVDNLYNIIHYNDPIAYRVNACVDVDYAANLQPATVPSATSSWLQTIGSVFRRASTMAPPNPAGASSSFMEPLRERPAVTKLPSTIELETHNFSREEVAERKMFALNENGQLLDVAGFC
ncbi:ddhd domain protein [Lasallia pustulata]|uniref:Ddhd domain protein n=1 Tax=Lasallia pustulata TaxID=136370 RepID=A0A1W5DAP8_9LECA|nr:ddhd domain protein [Lasallia pustulata]